MTTTSTRFFRFDLLNNKILGTAESFQKANIGFGDAYDELMELKSKQPSFAYEVIASKAMKKLTKGKKPKKTYAGLTYELMEAYISIQKNAEDEWADYRAVRADAEKKYDSIYPVVKKWFLGEFDPWGKGFDVRKAKSEIAQELIHNAVLRNMYAEVVADANDADEIA